VPPPEKPEAAEETDDKSEPAKAPESKADDPADEPNVEPSRASWNIKKLLSSKWSWLALGTFVLGWAAIFLQKSNNFWLQVATALAVAFVAITVFLFIRRAQIKAMINSMKNAMRRGAGPPDARAVNRGLRLTVVCCSMAAIGALAFLILRAVLKDLNVYLLAEVAVSLTVFPLSIYIGNHISKSADRENKPLSIWTTGLIMLLTLGSACALAWGGMHAGIGSHWLLAFLGTAAVLSIGLFMLLIGAGKTQYAVYKDRSLGDRLADGASILLHYPIIWLSIPGAWLWRLIGAPVARLWRSIRNGVVAAFRFTKSLVTRCWKFLRRKATLAWRKLGQIFRPLWRNSAFRLAVIALPIAALGVMIYAVLAKAASINYWLLAALILLLLILLALLWFFRKKISRFVLEELFMPMPDLMQFFMQPPLDMSTDWFIPIDDVVPVEADQAVVDELLPETYALARQLRKYLADCGSALVDKEDSPDGHDLIDEAELALIGQPNITERKLVNPVVVPAILSFLAYGSFGATVKGLNDFAPDEVPDNVELLYYGYHIMVGLGTFFLLLTTASLVALCVGKLYTNRVLLWILMLSFPFPYIATTAGWMVAELGRQPWLVYGLQKTVHGTSPLVYGGNVAFSTLGFMGLYVVVGLLFLYLVLKEIQNGPEPVLKIVEQAD